MTDRAHELFMEFRQKLNGIVKLANQAILAEESQSKDKYSYQIGQMAQELAKACALLTDMDDIESGHLNLESDLFSLANVFKDLQNQLAERVKQKNLQFTTQIPKDVPPEVLGDSARLTQILLNLTSNAVEHTEHGSIDVKVELVKQTTESVELQFSVQDTGVGLTKEQMQELQGDQATAKGKQGSSISPISGLGLQICRQLVEMMKGRIWIESPPEGGSLFAFTVVFPLGQQATPSPSPLNPQDLLKDMRVLVVDDNVTMQLTLRFMLEALGFRVTATGSGSEAIELIEQADSVDPFVLVFMDWMMPGMDGLEASKRIVDNKKLQWSPVIIMVSAYGRDDIRLKAKGVGVEGFLEKPVNRTDLVEMTLNLLGLKSASTEG